MRFITFYVLILSLWLSQAAAAAVDLQSLLQSGREHLYKWQVDEASAIADQALKIAVTPQDKGFSYYLKSEVEFHKGNYGKAGEYARRRANCFRATGKLPIF
jgi:hypothetical protein